jgi:hypothetical protein
MVGPGTRCSRISFRQNTSAIFLAGLMMQAFILQFNELFSIFIFFAIFLCFGILYIEFEVVILAFRPWQSWSSTQRSAWKGYKLFR